MSLETAAIATNRFGLGARPGEMQAVSADPIGWLEAQIAPERALPAPLAALPSSADDISAFRRWTASIGVGAGASATSPVSRGVGMGRLGGRGFDPSGDSISGGGGASRLPPGMTVEGSFGQVLGVRYAHAAGARFKTAVDTDKPFFERWVRFWSNHFTVSAAKPATVAMPPAFERDVIRRYAAGSFTEMLVASSRHPGMLTYLDQILSIGPDSALAHNPQVLPPYLRDKMKGLNENLGREILELHTLGVRSGYTQADVRALALMLTGWSARQQDAGGSSDLFRYLAAAHEPGPQTLLGKTYPDKGEEQALAALVDLSHHPATADHIATKLTRHFIADDPPPAAVARVSAAFRDSRGDLPTVAKALVRSPQAWTPQPRKFKPPEDYLISAQRALNTNAMGERVIVQLLTKMGQRPSAPAGPDGWADLEGAWVGADPMWKRLEWAAAASKGYATASADPAAIANAALGPQLTADTLKAIRAAESPAQGLAIFLVSPEFQRR